MDYKFNRLHVSHDSWSHYDRIGLGEEEEQRFRCYQEHDHLYDIHDSLFRHWICIRFWRLDSRNHRGLVRMGGCIHSKRSLSREIAALLLCHFSCRVNTGDWKYGRASETQAFDWVYSPVTNIDISNSDVLGMESVR
jgi:hypothetical protein